ncbi:MAG: ABC transporter ATP-binding protein [Anaerolineales bacterium]|nr:ABC transporter ATP-binding protein [Anaerolineales bacterium]
MKTQSDYSLETEDLRRVYETTRGIFRKTQVKREALKGINLQVKQGELFGLLGPNGAGKTTFIKILSTMLLPTSGRAFVAGYDVVRQTEQVRKCIGVVLGGERGLYYRLTARENMEHWAALYRVPRDVAPQRITRLLEMVGLHDRADDRVEVFSRGLKQRLHIARGLLSAPPVIFLDEPTIGLDPVAARDLRALVGNLKSEGITILLTTHQMHEAETMCDRVAFIKEGEIVSLDTPRALTRAIESIQLLKVEFDVGAQTPSAQLEEMAGVHEVQMSTNAEGFSLQIKAEKDAIPHILQVLSQTDVQQINSREPSLEDVYIQLLGMKGQKHD